MIWAAWSEPTASEGLASVLVFCAPDSAMKLSLLLCFFKIIFKFRRAYTFEITLSKYDSTDKFLFT